MVVRSRMRSVSIAAAVAAGNIAFPFTAYAVPITHIAISFTETANEMGIIDVTPVTAACEPVTPPSCTEDLRIRNTGSEEARRGLLFGTNTIPTTLPPGFMLGTQYTAFLGAIENVVGNRRFASDKILMTLTSAELDIDFYPCLGSAGSLNVLAVHLAFG
jgi:hypothetical protein